MSKAMKQKRIKPRNEHLHNLLSASVSERHEDKKVDFSRARDQASVRKAIKEYYV